MRFHIRASEPVQSAAYFPEALHREQLRWGTSNIDTDGRWLCYRFVIGNLSNFYTRIQALAAKYSTVRKRIPTLDTQELYETLDSIRSTRIIYNDYAGAISQISREATYAMDARGNRYGLERNQTVGFRGIITSTEQPWSLDSFAMSELHRARHRLLNLGATSALPFSMVQHPWAVRQALETQLFEVYNIAWAEYTTEPTPERLVSVQQAEQAIHDYTLQSMSWFQNVGSWEFMEALPFPDLHQTKQLWQNGRINTINYDFAEPWDLPLPPVSTHKVTALRRAELTNGKVHIRITTNPVLATMEHASLAVARHQISYGPHFSVGRALVQGPTEKSATGEADRSFGRVKFENDAPKAERGKWWEGDPLLSTGGRRGWQAITSDETLPEPQLTVYHRTTGIDRIQAERIESALNSDRPVILNVDLNQGVAPVLVLPRGFWDMQVAPLYTEGRRLTPTHNGNEVSGWATLQANQEELLVEPPSYGFISRPSSGRPMRQGNLSEILNYD